jgi:phosphoribosylformylglycinamidine cyclo-ligase
MEKTTYADSGVNIELGDDVSKILYNAAKQTWKNRKGKLGELIVPFDDFTGVRAIDVSNLPKGTLMNIGFDGVGTKMELAERLNDHSTIAYDLFAMVCDDAVVRGAEPVLIGSILDVNSLGKGKETYIEQVRQLAEGYIGAAKAANVAIVNGEVAELGNRVGGYGNFNYNWGAAVVWFAKKDRLFTGKEIKEDDYLIGLEEKGFRSNGLSLVRKIMQNTHGENWHKSAYQGQSLAKLALQPSQIYSGAVVEMFGGYNGKPKAEVHGVAHITGGGIPGKLGRVLKPSGYGARIDSPFEPSALMLYCQEKGNVSDEEAYKTWNMGQGMIVISPEPDKVMKIAYKHRIGSKVIGKVTSESEISIRNKGYRAQGDYLVF